MLAVLGRGPSCVGCSSNCTGLATRSNSTPSSRSMCGEVAVGRPADRRAARSAVWTGAHTPFMSGAPRSTRRRSWLANISSSSGDARPSRLSNAGRASANALVGGQVGPPDALAELRPEPVGLQHHQADEPAVLGPVVADQRVRGRAPGRTSASGRRRRARTPRCRATASTWRRPSSDTSTTGASPVRSRWNSAAAMPPAIVMPPGRSPNAAPGADRPLGVGRA